jgi:hypothetical protein
MEALALLKLRFRLVPRVVTAEITTTAMRATISPYSIAVAPVSSSTNLQKSAFIYTILSRLEHFAPGTTGVPRRKLPVIS